MITLVTAIILVGAVFWFLEKTRTGKSMRAYSDNEDLALLSGINPERVVLITWIITAMLAATAGTLYGLDKSYKPFTYLSLLLPIFSAAISAASAALSVRSPGDLSSLSRSLTITFAYKKVLFYLRGMALTADAACQRTTRSPCHLSFWSSCCDQTDRAVWRKTL